MAFFEKKLSRVDIYDGYIIHVHKDEVELPDGNTSFREIVDHHGGVCIVAVDSDGGVFVVRQFRYAYGTMPGTGASGAAFSGKPIYAKTVF